MHSRPPFSHQAKYPGGGKIWGSGVCSTQKVGRYFWAKKNVVGGAGAGNYLEGI